jgi:hypothetical protein
MAILHRRAGRLTAQNGGFRGGQDAAHAAAWLGAPCDFAPPPPPGPADPACARGLVGDVGQGKGTGEVCCAKACGVCAHPSAACKARPWGYRRVSLRSSRCRHVHCTPGLLIFMILKSARFCCGGAAGPQARPGGGEDCCPSVIAKANRSCAARGGSRGLHHHRPMIALAPASGPTGRWACLSRSSARRS